MDLAYTPYSVSCQQRHKTIIRSSETHHGRRQDEFQEGAHDDSRGVQKISERVAHVDYFLYMYININFSAA